MLSHTLFYDRHCVYTATDTPPPEQASSSDNEEVELQIRPHPNDPSMAGEAIRTLVTSKLCTVAHLVKYLAISSHLDSADTPKSECMMLILLLVAGVLC